MTRYSNLIKEAMQLSNDSGHLRRQVACVHRGHIRRTESAPLERLSSDANLKRKTRDRGMLGSWSVAVKLHALDNAQWRTGASEQSLRYFKS